MSFRSALVAATILPLLCGCGERSANGPPAGPSGGDEPRAEKPAQKTKPDAVNGHEKSKDESTDEKAGPLSFETRLKYHRAQEKARHAFRIGGAKRPFDAAYPPGTFADKVRLQGAKVRLLRDRFGVAVTTRELRKEMNRIDRRSRRKDILQALKEACDNDERIVRGCIAAPIVVERKLREVFQARQKEIQAAVVREMTRLGEGLTAANFRAHAGKRYREITYFIGPRKAGAPRRPNELTPPLREVLLKELKEPGDISPVVPFGTALRVFVCVDRTDRELRAGILEVPFVTYDEWIARETGIPMR